MRRIELILLLAVTALAGSCGASDLFAFKSVTITGDFCILAAPMVPDTPEISDYIADNDPRLADSMIVHNTLGERQCDWKF